MCKHNQYYMLINPNMMRVDESYQHKAYPSQVKKIVDNFNMDVFNAPKVSHRKDGYYYIFDGQKSWLAHKDVFGDNVPINCRVYEGLTYADEVTLFNLQSGCVVPVTTRDKLKAMINVPGSDGWNFNEATKTAGIELSLDNIKAKNRITAATAAYMAWKVLGKDDYINVLYVIKNAWDGDGASFRQEIIKGLTYLYHTQSELIQNDKMITALSRHNPDWYVRNSHDMYGNITRKFAQMFVEAYNYHRQTNRLVEFWRA